MSRGPRARPSLLAFGALLLLPALTLPAFGGGILATPTFAAPVNLPNSTGFGEPSIDAAPDGTLYIVAPGTRTWRSDDRGATWTRQALTLGDSGDSDIEVDINGIVYGSDLFDNAPVSVSNNKAAAYQFSTDTNTGGGLDREWIAVAGAGHVYATVRDGGNEEISISHDGAQTFTAPRTVASNTNLRGNIYAASVNDLYIPYTSSQNDDLNLAVSHDAGITWTIRMVAQPSSLCLFPGVARDDGGVLYVVWCENSPIGFPQASASRVFVSVSKNDGATWSAPLQLSDETHASVFPWIVAGAAGRVMVAWYDGVPPLPQWPIKDPNLALLIDWHVTVAWSVNADGAAPTFTRTAASPVMHTGIICTSGTGCVPGTRGLLDFFEIVEQPGGNLAIAYAGGDSIGIPGAGGDIGTVVSLFAVVQSGGTNLRTG